MISQEPNTLKIAGRSKGFQLDKIVLYKDRSFDQAAAIAATAKEERENCPTLSLSNTVPNAKIDIYPNPTSSTLTINLKTNPKNATYQIFDVSGKEVLFGSLLKAKNSIPVAGLKNGIYLIQVNEEGSIKTSKLLKI